VRSGVLCGSRSKIPSCGPACVPAVHTETEVRLVLASVRECVRLCYECCCLNRRILLLKGPRRPGRSRQVETPAAKSPRGPTTALTQWSGPAVLRAGSRISVPPTVPAWKGATAAGGLEDAPPLKWIRRRAVLTILPQVAPSKVPPS
jgi:hypothetical protein